MLLIDAKNISFSYGNKEILKNIDFQLYKGDVLSLIGQNGCGKTTLFNAYTGAHLKVANWPGVTVEKKEGAMQFHNENYKLVDLPGIYSLTSYTMEEQVSRQYILDDEVDIVVDERFNDLGHLVKRVYF